MSIWSNINKVQEIRTRYFRTSKDDVNHCFDCSIYSCNSHGQRGAFCDCGLIHDLIWLDWSLAVVLYKDFEEDYYLHQTGEKVPELTKERIEEQNECIKILEEVFGKATLPELVDIEEEYRDMKKVFEAVFPDDYPDCYNRLELWREDKLKEINYDKDASK